MNEKDTYTKTIRIPAEWKTKLTNLAKDKDRSVNYLIKKAIEELINKRR